MRPTAGWRSRPRWCAASSSGRTRSMSTISSCWRRSPPRCPRSLFRVPARCIFRGGDKAVTAHAYRDVDEFWDDTVEAYRKELTALAAAGCRYVQIDETAFAKFADPAVQASLAARGDDWRTLIDRYIEVTNRVLRGIDGIKVGMHLCRGNRGGHWHAEGSYDTVADKLFNALDIAFFFLEYDS